MLRKDTAGREERAQRCETAWHIRGSTETQYYLRHTARTDSARRVRDYPHRSVYTILKSLDFILGK
jgi:hypothetical protein